ncbi:MAG TPA: MFS transporter [Croceicoccus sp.]|nr:MFS transporter [Croceicoccus sp.]
MVAASPRVEDVPSPSAVAHSGRWTATAILSTGFALSYIDRQVLSLLVPSIKQALGLSDTQIGLLQGISFSLFYVAASLPLAALADRRNRARFAATCIAVWSVLGRKGWRIQDLEGFADNRPVFAR